MKKLILTGVGLLALPAALFAAGLDLSWDDCLGAGNPTTDKVFDCSGTAAYNLVIQFTSPVLLDHCNAITGYLDIQNETPGPLAPFWHFERGACQYPQGDPLGAFLLDDIRMLPTCSSNHADIWGGDGTGGIADIPAYGADYPADGRGRFLLADFRLDGQRVEAGVKYYAFHLRFSTARRGECAGCTDRVAIVLNALVLGSSDGSLPVELTTAEKMNCATINGASTSTCAATPTRSTTWGRLKAMYR
jgi:hypothetical protein